MRVTSGMLVQNAIRNINGNLSRLDTLQQKASTGKQIQYASDNPVIATRSIKIKSYLSEVEQLQKNTEDAKSWMNFCESSLSQIDENVDRIRELTVEAANGTYSDDDLNAVKEEITEIKKSILETGNSNYSGRYVFAGYNTGDAPFESVSTAVGEKIMYNGKYLSLGGPISSSVSDEDYKAFYLDNMDKISGQPEMQSAVINTFTATAPALDFSLSLDGVSQSISLTDGTTYDADTLQIELQSKINAAFPSGTGQPGPLIKVSTQDDKLKLTVQDGSSIQIDSGTLNVKTIGFTGGTESIANAKQEIEYKMGVGNLITINVEGNEMFGKGEESLFNTLTKLEMALEGETSYKTATYDEGPPAEVIVETHELDISSLLGDLDLDLSRILKSRSVLGAKTNYVELTQNRLSSNNVTFTELLSNTEDADYAEVSMKLASAETVYSAALSASAKVIQPSLLDFLT